MKPLIDYISPPKFDWDGHIHTFNHKTTISKCATNCVCFMDIEFDELNDINIMDSYKRYIENDYDKYNDILLVTGINIDDIKNVYNKYSSIIKGFGELKCYDKYNEKKLPYKKIKFVREVLAFSSKNGNLPVYIHWELNDTDDLTKITNVIKQYNQIPIVLCHFGINDYNSDFAVPSAMQLQREYNNVWLDLSYTALDYFSKNIIKLSNYDYSRIIIGSDYNNKIFGKNHDENDRNTIIDKINNIIKYTKISNANNIKKLFGINR